MLYAVMGYEESIKALEEFKYHFKCKIHDSVPFDDKTKYNEYIKGMFEAIDEFSDVVVSELAEEFQEYQKDNK